MEQKPVEKVSKKTHGGDRIQGLQGFAGLGKPWFDRKSPESFVKSQGWFGLWMFDVRRGVVPFIHGIPFKLDQETNRKSPFNKSLQRFLQKSAKVVFYSAKAPRRPAYFDAPQPPPRQPGPCWAEELRTKTSQVSLTCSDCSTSSSVYLSISCDTAVLPQLTTTTGAFDKSWDDCGMDGMIKKKVQQEMETN